MGHVSPGSNIDTVLQYSYNNCIDLHYLEYEFFGPKVID
jgi:hypothetical protein